MKTNQILLVAGLAAAGFVAWKMLGKRRNSGATYSGEQPPGMWSGNSGAGSPGSSTSDDSAKWGFLSSAVSQGAGVINNLIDNIDWDSEDTENAMDELGETSAVANKI